MVVRDKLYIERVVDGDGSAITPAAAFDSGAIR